MVVLAKLDCQLNEDPDANGDQADSSNVGHHLLSSDDSQVVAQIYLTFFIKAPWDKKVMLNVKYSLSFMNHACTSDAPYLPQAA